MGPTISLVKSKEHFEGVQQALMLIRNDIKEALSNIDTLVIKINLVITKTPARPAGVLFAITPVQAVKSFIDFVSPDYKKKILIVEETCWGKTKEGFSMYGYDDLAKAYDNVELIDMKDDETIWKEIPYSQGKLNIPFNKTMLEAPLLVSIARPKVHCNVALTAGIKNVVIGAVEGYKNRKGLHTDKDLHEVMAEIAKIVLPDLVIIDGVAGMEESGPIQGKENKPGWTLASMDALAADSLCAYLMDFNIKGIPYLMKMKKFGLGELFPLDPIQVIGENPDQLVTPFKPYRKFRDELQKCNIKRKLS